MQTLVGFQTASTLLPGPPLPSACLDLAPPLLPHPTAPHAPGIAGNCSFKKPRDLLSKGLCLHSPGWAQATGGQGQLRSWARKGRLPTHGRAQVHLRQPCRPASLTPTRSLTLYAGTRDESPRCLQRAQDCPGGTAVPLPEPLTNGALRNPPYAPLSTVRPGLLSTSVFLGEHVTPDRFHTRAERGPGRDGPTEVSTEAASSGGLRPSPEGLSVLSAVPDGQWDPSSPIWPACEPYKAQKEDQQG